MTLPETEPWGPDADHVEALRMNTNWDRISAIVDELRKRTTTEGDE